MQTKNKWLFSSAHYKVPRTSSIASVMTGLVNEKYFNYIFVYLFQFKLIIKRICNLLVYQWFLSPRIDSLKNESEIFQKFNEPNTLSVKLTQLKSYPQVCNHVWENSIIDKNNFFSNTHLKFQIAVTHEQEDNIKEFLGGNSSNTSPLPFCNKNALSMNNPNEAKKLPFYRQGEWIYLWLWCSGV